MTAEQLNVMERVAGQASMEGDGDVAAEAILTLVAEVRRLREVERRFECHWHGADLTPADERIVTKAEALLDGKGDTVTVPMGLYGDVCQIARDGVHTAAALRAEILVLQGKPGSDAQAAAR